MIKRNISAGFFLSFTLPKLYCCYSDNIQKKGNTSCVDIMYGTLLCSLWITSHSACWVIDSSSRWISWRDEKLCLGSMEILPSQEICCSFDHHAAVEFVQHEDAPLCRSTSYRKFLPFTSVGDSLNFSKCVLKHKTSIQNLMATTWYTFVSTTFCTLSNFMCTTCVHVKGDA